MDKPKMTVEMWEALKVHIINKREKRKQEQEQDAALERLKKEQEQKRKQDAMTLEEIKDQLGKLETKLGDLKNEKHILFLQLKKVLNEDETRKRQRESELMAAAQGLCAPHQYHPYYMPASLIAAGGRPTIYQKLTPLSAGVAPHSLPITTSIISSSQNIPTTSHSSSSGSNNSVAIKRIPIKRPHERSPSPPPPTSVPYTGNFPNYKTSIAYTNTPSKLIFNVALF